MITRTDFPEDLSILLSGDTQRIIPVSQQFTDFGITEIEHSDHQHCIEIILKQEPHAVILFAENHEAVLLELCYLLRLYSRAHQSRIIVILSKNDPQAELEFFRAGADDCFTMPDQFELICYHVLRQIQTGTNENAAILHFRNGTQSLQIDRESYQAFLNNIAIHLTRKEFELLFQMANSPGKIFSREELFRSVWKEEVSPNGRTIDVHILRLRKKVGQQYFSTLKGVGYRFNTLS